MRLTLHDLHKLAATRKLAMLTCYDATFAALFDACEVDMLLVGDSLGMTIQGHDSTVPVTLLFTGLGRCQACAYWPITRVSVILGNCSMICWRQCGAHSGRGG